MIDATGTGSERPCVPCKRGEGALKRVTEFARFHAEGQPISMVTCYDAWSARIIGQSKIDAVLVGDSVAMVMHGHESTVQASTEMMALHTAAVRRGIGETFVVADIPFPEHRKGIQVAMESVDQLAKAGANAVKVEGARGHLDVIRHIVESGIPVMGHLGLTPQSVNAIGGYRVQGREEASARQLLEDAKSLEEAGIFSLVLECVPADLARQVSAELDIPTIGIGSGPHCGGQILVLQDLLGMNVGFKPRFLRTYMEGVRDIRSALDRFDGDIKGSRFPSKEESFST